MIFIKNKHSKNRTLVIRYIIFDTETTGLDPLSGDRVIEIGCVEMLDKQISGKEYNQLINPECTISQETIEITHITNEIVADKPVFKNIANDFLTFLQDNSSGAEKIVLVAHNASFDLKFLNHELKLAGFEGALSKFEVLDTLEIARRKYPGQKASLDVLCNRFGISLEERKKEGHGALLDSKILADVFIKLLEDTNVDTLGTDELDFVGFKKRNEVLKAREIYKLTEEDLQKHKQFLEENEINIE